MSISYAENISPTLQWVTPGLAVTFGAAHGGRDIQNSYNTNGINNTTQETKTLVMDPYQRSPLERLFAQIGNGADEASLSKALNKLFKHLDGKSADYTFNTLKKLFDGLEERGYDPFNSPQIVFEINQFLSFNDMGLDIEFFNTGPNSTGGVPEPDVSINRYAIEHHFDGERHKPLQHVQPFSGLSYGS